jgi:S-adenosylmethionine:tRNA ribosyltransferase-isomerase
VAVGTTSARVLESAALHNADRTCKTYRGDTQLYITPSYTFGAVDAMITNFHLPRSTLLAMVGAFAGTELMWTVYREAIREQYRFYSFGDAMLII